VTDDASHAAFFEEVTKEDIKGNGRIRPIGASHFAERARRIQNIQNMLLMKQDPTIAPHWSGKKTAQILAQELGEDELYGENIAVQEQLETQQAMQDAEADNVDRLQQQEEMGL
jgi:hypothetical protein